MLKNKTFLYIGAMGMGDKIASIPKLLQLKKEGYHITLLNYETKHFKLFLYDLDDIIKLYKDNNLYDDILYIPYNKIKLIWFVIKNFRKFDISYTPVKTFFSGLWGRLLGKKFTLILPGKIIYVL